jgi:pimeloyl-ACP methyl ester carboxylesterase
VVGWQENTVRANGIDIHYWRTGGNKPPVVLLHGLTDSGRCWQLAAEALSDEYDLIMPDARGHGRSSVPEQGYRTEDRVADVLGLIEALGLERPAVVGHSMGAETSAMLAADAPSAISCAVLEDPSFRLQPLGDVADEWAQDLLKQKQLTHQQLVAQARVDLATWNPATLDSWAESKLEADPRVFMWLREPRTPWRSFVNRISVPTLLVTAETERGAIVTPETAQEIASINPHVRVAHIAGAGHCIRYEQHDAFVAVVRTFLREHTTA